MRQTLMAGVLVGSVCLASVAVGQAPPPSNYEHLKELEYFIGEWDVKGGSPDEESSEAQFKSEWNLNKNFQMWTATVKVEGKDFVVYRGMIGWDAPTKAIKGWHFWAMGIQSETVMSKTDNGWEHVITASLPDGKKDTIEGVFTIVDENTYSYRDGMFDFTAKRRESSPAETSKTSEEKAATTDEKAVKEDLAKLQGKWELQGPTLRNVKTMKGDKETITRYNKDGGLVRAHTTTITLTVRDGIRFFRFSGIEVTEGPQKGQKSPFEGGYIYKIDGDSFYEIRGAMAGGWDGKPRVLTWTRVKQ